MQDIFKLKQTTRSAQNPNELIHHRPKQVAFGSKSLLTLGPQIWNALHYLKTFKRLRD